VGTNSPWAAQKLLGGCSLLANSSVCLTPLSVHSMLLPMLGQCWCWCWDPERTLHRPPQMTWSSDSDMVKVSWSHGLLVLPRHCSLLLCHLALVTQKEFHETFPIFPQCKPAAPVCAWSLPSSDIVLPGPGAQGGKDTSDC
jgi:hypothetical protein